MSRRLRVYPHRVASDGSVTWGPWLIYRDGLACELPARLSGWDYARSEEVEINVDVDVSVFRDETGLRLRDRVFVVAVADCQPADCRVVAHLPVQVQSLSHATVRLVIPPGEFASSTKLSGHIVLADNGSPNRDLRAYKEAARIHSSKPYTVALEGDAGRFPTEATSFSSLGFGNAPWMIDAKFSDLSDSFVATVRLFLNTDNAVAKLLLNNTRSADLAPLLRAEILRVLLGTVSHGNFETKIEEFDDESVGAVLDGMCRMFLDRDLVSAIRLFEQDPSRFELLLHSKIEPLDFLMK